MKNILRLWIASLFILNFQTVSFADELPYEMKPDVIDLWKLSQSGYHDSIVDYLAQDKFVRFETPRSGKGSLDVYDLNDRTIESHLDFPEGRSIAPFYVDPSTIAVFSYKEVDYSPTELELGIYSFPDLTLTKSLKIPNVAVTNAFYLPKLNGYLFLGWEDLVFVDNQFNIRTAHFDGVQFSFAFEKNQDVAVYTTASPIAGELTTKVHVWSLEDWKEINSFDIPGTDNVVGTVYKNNHYITFLNVAHGIKSCKTFDFVTGLPVSKLDYKCNYTYIGEKYVDISSPQIIRSAVFPKVNDYDKAYGVEIVDFDTGDVRKTIKTERRITSAQYFDSEKYFLMISSTSVFIYETANWTLIYNDEFIADRWAKSGFFDSNRKLLIADVISGRMAIVDIETIIQHYENN